jgi:hypothetical protein
VQPLFEVLPSRVAKAPGGRYWDSSLTIFLAASIEQLILNQLLNVLVKALKIEETHNCDGSLLGFPVATSYTFGASRLLCGKRVKQMQPRRKKFQTGCVFLDAKSKTWFFRYYVDGKRRAERIGTKKEFPTKTQAMQVAEPMRGRFLVQGESKPAPSSLASVWQGYAKEKMPERASTKRGYLIWVNNYILPRWGKTPLPEIKARAVELWLSGLASLQKAGATFA